MAFNARSMGKLIEREDTCMDRFNVWRTYIHVHGRLMHIERCISLGRHTCMNGGVINASACMARFKAPSKFHVQSMHVGGPLEFPKHLFGQETPFGSFMHPMAEPRQSHWLPKFAHT